MMNRRGFLGGLLKGVVIAVASTSVVGRGILSSDPIETLSALNVVNIYSANDFPEPVDGIISLQDNTTYLIHNEINMKGPIMFGADTSFTSNNPKYDFIYAGTGNF